MEGERQIRDLRALLEVSKAMAGEHSLDNLLQIIVQKADEVMEADRCTLFLYDESRNELWSKIAEQLVGLREIRFPVDVGIAGEVATTRTACNVPDAHADRRFNRDFDLQTGYRTQSILCVPMISSSGKLIGVIEILKKGARRDSITRTRPFCGLWAAWRGSPLNGHSSRRPILKSSDWRRR